MRTLLLLGCLLSGCGLTANQKCDLIALGTAPPPGASPQVRQSWCGGHPTRNKVGPTEPACCFWSSAPASCGVDCAAVSPVLFGVGAIDDEGDGGGSQCCLFVVDGLVASKVVAFD